MVNNQIKIGDVAPDFTLKSTENEVVTLSNCKNKKAIAIVFTCNHCPYAQAYEERLIAIQDKYSDRGFQIIAINSNDDIAYPEDSFEEMKIRSNRIGYNYLYLRDDSQQVAKDYAANSTPHIFLLDSGLVIRYMGKIDDNWKEPNRVISKYLEDAIEEVLSDKEVSVPETFAIGCSIKWK